MKFAKVERMAAGVVRRPAIHPGKVDRVKIPQSYEELMAGPAGEVKAVFQEYELLAAKADRAFQKVAGEHGALVKCHAGCHDCCHALFGLFLVESVYLGYHFQWLDGDEQREAVARAQGFDRECAAIQAGQDDSGVLSLARERVRCPLLSEEQRCLLYDRRPVTCRVYGIPTAIHGRSHVCGKSGFVKGGSFPAFNLDLANRELYRLSGGLLAAAGHRSPESASSLLFAVSRSLHLAPPELLEGL